MEMIVDPLRQGGVDPFNSGEVGGGGATHALGRAEAVEQGLLPALADARDFIERVLPEV